MLKTGGKPGTQTQAAAFGGDHAERVLLATDGGTGSEPAVAWLAERATRHPLTIEIVTVVDIDGIPAELTAAMTARAQVAAARAAAGLRAEGLESPTSVIYGPVRQVLEVASRYVDLMVVGAERTGRADPASRGTVSSAIARVAWCPVVAIPRNWRPVDGPVVIGVAGDASDDEPLRFAVAEARAAHRRLRLVHAWQLPTLVMPGLEVAEHAERHHETLDRIVADVGRDDPDLPVEGVLRESDPSEALSAEAAGAQLLVVGAHRRGAIERFFLGSVGRKLLATLPCPVAVVPPVGPERA
jgi:nucleotide-binding universal stress UspA family protein